MLSSRTRSIVEFASGLGNGGSTLHAMHVLQEKYGWHNLQKKRILLIHAGGYSQRTPTSSCLGKIATSIPKG